MLNGPVLNPDAIQALRDLSPDGDTHFLRELVSIYLEDTPKQIDALEAALARQDPAAIIRAAHTLKGSAGNFGAARFTQLAQEIEAYGKANDLAAASQALPAFKAEHALVITALKQLAAGT